MAAVADLVARGRRRRGHPRQRPPGRQPAGQERARRGRRTPRPAGLVRRADPGDARLRADGRARRRAGPAAASTGARADRRHPHARRRRRPGLHRPTKPIGRFLPAEEAALLVDHGETWEDRGEKGWRRVVASPEPLEILDAPAVQALVDAGFVVVANGGGGIPVVARRPTARCAASRPSSTRTSAPRCSARPSAPTCSSSPPTCPHAVLRFGTPEAEPIGRVTVAQMRGVRRRGPLRQRLDGAEGRGRLPVRRATGGARRDHRPRPASSTRWPAAPAPSSYPTDPPNREEPPCPSAIEVRKVPIHSVADASRARQAHRRRRDGRRPGDRDHRQDRGQRRRQRLHADHRRPGVPRGAGREGRARRAGQGDPDRLVRRHRRRDQPARDDLRHLPTPSRPRRAAADRRVRDERAAAARGHRPRAR